MHRHITPDYFGYRDDDDGVLVTKEAAVEAAKLAEALKKLRSAEASAGGSLVDTGAVHAVERRAHEEDEQDFRTFLEQHLSTIHTADSTGAPSIAGAGGGSQGNEVKKMTKEQVDAENALLEERKSSLLSMLL